MKEESSLQKKRFSQLKQGTIGPIKARNYWPQHFLLIVCHKKNSVKKLSTNTIEIKHNFAQTRHLYTRPAPTRSQFHQPQIQMQLTLRSERRIPLEIIAELMVDLMRLPIERC